MTHFKAPRGMAGVIAEYGDIRKYIRADGSISPTWETENIVRIKLPDTLPLSWNPALRVSQIAVHKKLAPNLTEVLNELDRLGLFKELKNYGGGYSYRSQRGSSVLSMHSFGIAFDFDTINNPLGAAPKMNPGIVAIFEHYGWTWGGRWKRIDAQHFQMASGI